LKGQPTSEEGMVTILDIGKEKITQVEIATESELIHQKPETKEGWHHFSELEEGWSQEASWPSCSAYPAWAESS